MGDPVVGVLVKWRKHKNENRLFQIHNFHWDDVSVCFCESVLNHWKSHRIDYHSSCRLYIWNIILREHRGRVSSVSVSEDGEWALSSGSDGAAILWRLPAMTRTHLLHASSGGRRIAMTIMWWKWHSGILGGRLHPNNVHALLLTVNNR